MVFVPIPTQGAKSDQSSEVKVDTENAHLILTWISIFLLGISAGLFALALA